MMATYNDDKHSKLALDTGQSGCIQDLELAWLLSKGATSNSLNDAWMQYLSSLGYTSGTVDDRKNQWLSGLDGGTLNDKLTRLWKDGTGGEIVTNGGFDTDSAWLKGTGWVIAGGVASCSGATPGDLQQNGIITPGVSYKLVLTILGYVSGSVHIFSWNGSAAVRLSSVYNANGTYTDDLTYGGDVASNFYIESSSFVGSIDNISVRPVLI